MSTSPDVQSSTPSCSFVTFGAVKVPVAVAIDAPSKISRSKVATTGVGGFPDLIGETAPYTQTCRPGVKTSERLSRLSENIYSPVSNSPKVLGPVASESVPLWTLGLLPVVSRNHEPSKSKSSLEESSIVVLVYPLIVGSRSSICNGRGRRRVDGAYQ